MKYFAIDVETANADYSSICQIGIAEFDRGVVIDKWSTLINPKAYFDPFNISIHGISESDVRNSPSFDQIYQEIKEKLHGRITIHHMSFDKVALSSVCDAYQLPEIQTKWLDSAKVVRRTWEEFSLKGYGLKNVTQYLQIDFKHHDALEDAIAAGIIVSHACELKNMTIEDWLDQVKGPIKYYHGNVNYSRSVKQEGNPQGTLFGENLVFTGQLTMSRKEAAAIAAKIGCSVSDSVSKKTTILVVGIQDQTSLAGYTKSSKHRKAEELISKGYPIKILSEKDFTLLCNSCDDSLNIVIPDSSLSVNRAGNSLGKKANKPIKVDSTKEFSSIEEFDDTLSNDPKLREEVGKRIEAWRAFPTHSREERESVAKKFSIKIDKLAAYYEEHGLESYEEDDEAELILSIDDELSELNRVCDELVHNDTGVRNFYFDIKNSIETIQLDLDEFDYPEKVQEYAMLVIVELTSLKDEIYLLDD